MYYFETGVCASRSSQMVLGVSLNQPTAADLAARRKNCILPRNAACAVVFPAMPGSGVSSFARRPLCRGYKDPYIQVGSDSEQEEEPVDEAAKWAGLFKERVYDRDHARVKKSTDKFFNRVFPHKLLVEKKPPERLETKFKELQKVVKTLGAKNEEGCAENEKSSFSAVVQKLRAAESRRKAKIKTIRAARLEMIQARQEARKEREAAAQEVPREFTLQDFVGVGEDFENEDKGEGQVEDEGEDEADDYVGSDYDDSGDETGYSTDDLIGAYSKDEILEDFSSDELRTDSEYSDESDWEEDVRESAKPANEEPKAPASPPVYFSEESDIAKMNDLSQLTVTQLRNMCKHQKIKGYTKKKKEELVALLCANS